MLTVALVVPIDATGTAAVLVKLIGKVKVVQAVVTGTLITPPWAGLPIVSDRAGCDKRFIKIQQNGKCRCRAE